MNPTPPLAVQRLDPVVLRVADIERSIAFHRELLGRDGVGSDPDGDLLEPKGAPR